MLTAMPAVKPVITRLRHVFHQRADAKNAGGDQHQASQQRAENQAAIAESLDHGEDHGNEGGGRAPDLHARTPQGGDQKPGDDRGM